MVRYSSGTRSILMLYCDSASAVAGPTAHSLTPFRSLTSPGPASRRRMKCETALALVNTTQSNSPIWAQTRPSGAGFFGATI